MDGDGDDGDAADSEAPSSKVASTEKKQETPQETCSRWIDKLVISDILQGKKMGVSLRHAETACGKLPVKEKLQLNTHLRTARSAEALAAGNLASLGQTALDEHLANLIALPSLEWPASVQKGLFELQELELVKRCLSSMGKPEFADLWARVRPYVCEGDQPTTLKDPHLRNLSLTKQEKAAVFLDIMVTQLFLPLILSGEGKHRMMLSLCYSVKAAIEKDLESEDLDDQIVESLFDLQIASRAIEQVIRLDWASLGSYREDIMVLKSSPAEKSETLLHICNALDETGYYKEQLAECVKALRTLELHQSAMTQAEQTVNVNADLSESTVGSLTETLHYLPTLMADVPGDVLQPLLDGVKKKFMDVWALFKVGFLKHHPGSQQQLMQGVIFEASVCYPQDKDIAAVKDEFGELLVSVVGNKKMSELLAVIASVERVVKDEERFPETKTLLKAIEDARAAQGLTVSGEQQAAVRTFLVVLLHHAFGVAESAEPDQMTSVVDLAKALMETASLVTSDQGISAKIEKLSGLCKWLALLKQFQSLGANLEEQLRADAGEKVLAEIMRGILQAKEWSKCDGVGEGLKEKLVEKATRIREDSRFILMQVGELALVEACNQAEPVAGGAPLGASWDQGLPVAATWEKTLERAKTTLLATSKDEFKEYESIKSNLKEARVSAPPSTHPNLGSKQRCPVSKGALT